LREEKKIEILIRKKKENRDTVSHSKEVANLVHLDPWRIEVCFVCFG
jgi:hypothetical protein